MKAYLIAINSKYIHPAMGVFSLVANSKYEVIYDVNGNRVDALEDVGTYNFVSPNENFAGHFIYDVWPWIWNGNSTEDSTERWQRALSFVGIYLE